MIRFRNPGTQYNTQIQVLKELYKELNNQEFFSLENMAVVIARSNMMTAYGYAGDSALELSKTESESMNSALMNAKMYAEVFRMLGWVTPYNEKKSYPLVFTLIGAHVAESDGDCIRLYEQCVLGINNPNELTNKMTYYENVRFFKCVLRSLIDLDNVMYKHELCLGPMSVNDLNESEYQDMIRSIKKLRGNYNNLKLAFSKLADSLGMKETPVDNCTRLPIAFLKTCNLVESVKSKKIYNKSLDCLQITEHGKDLYKKLSKMKDLRLNEFNKYSKEKQDGLIRIGIYSMLERSGYDISSVMDIIDKDKQLCKDILDGKDLLFSPYQTIRRDRIENALGLTTADKGKKKNDTFKLSSYTSSAASREQLTSINYLPINIKNNIVPGLLNTSEDNQFLGIVEKLYTQKYNSKKIVDYLFDYYSTATQTTFYPLIATLFKIVGFNCLVSRPGDNGSRWDAIIIDDFSSIPIEIKSPTEEMHVSVKAIRQALENKIILLSRETYKTTADITTLAVGYELPNDRAEVINLIYDIKKTYGYKIGIIDLKSLLSMAISTLIDGLGIEKDKLLYLEGLASATI